MIYKIYPSSRNISFSGILFLRNVSSVRFFTFVYIITISIFVIVNYLSVITSRFPDICRVLLLETKL